KIFTRNVSFSTLKSVPRRRRLSAIVREARAARRPLLLRRLAVAHRLGAVPAGEASVFVAASAVHRADAMEACRYVIDESRRPCPSGRRRCTTTVRSGRRTASSSTAPPPTALPRRRRGARLLRQQGESQRELMPNLPQNTVDCQCLNVLVCGW
ncbi:Os02g0517366, partial [Oryza sativa Japonica Group]